MDGIQGQDVASRGRREVDRLDPCGARMTQPTLFDALPSTNSPAFAIRRGSCTRMRLRGALPLVIGA